MRVAADSPLEDRADELTALERLRVRAGRLTASELRVARLAADGLTNREIAQSLLLTEKTIEVHLTSSYRKARHRLANAAGAGAARRP